MEYKVCFLPTWIDGHSKESASVRVRCNWITKYWDYADTYQEGMDLDEYDVLVFQKVWSSRRAKELSIKYKDKLKIFDLNDPVWLQNRERLERHLAHMDGATCVTRPLAEWLESRLPTRIIPDRIDLETHQARTEAGTGIVWAGYSQNYEVLQEVFLNYIKELDLPLTILSNEPCGDFPFIQWESAEQEIEALKQFAIVLNPRASHGIWRYKSLQKTHKAWSLGIPVAHSVAELRKLLKMGDLWSYGNSLRREVEEWWDVRLSVDEWKEYINELVDLH